RPGVPQHPVAFREQDLARHRIGTARSADLCVGRVGYWLDDVLPALDPGAGDRSAPAAGGTADRGALRELPRVPAHVDQPTHPATPPAPPLYENEPGYAP